ncbi:MAG: DUF3422 domain-containing protein [Cohaesibacter sp.]|jgi:uncharacterized membrane-anchored protein|nr:DUF3422 domain-containing protein [Cohaesibacter sp.]
MKSQQPLDHSLRAEIMDELHARPFSKLTAPSRIAYIALKPEEDGLHSPDKAREQLLDFLSFYGAQAPKEGAVYHFADLGKEGGPSLTLKWENHSEFATYTLTSSDMGDSPFAPDLHAHFRPEWLERYPARRITSAVIQLEMESDGMAVEHRVNTDLRQWFLNEGFAAAWVSDQMAVLAGNFHFDDEGHIRFAILGRKGIGPRRLGRIAQRVLEIETYKSLALLTLPVARPIFAELNQINADLSRIVTVMSEQDNDHKESLNKLQTLSARIAVLESSSAFRFSAGRAYEKLVHERIAILREERVLGRQLFAEFMNRRFDPIMRTCKATHDALQESADRAAKASELLSTRVSVTTAEQNRQLLHQMDRRAALQARLQETVEGLSVVAISYYAVSLLTYLLAPLTKMMPISKTMLAAGLVIPVVATAWIAMHRLKEKLIRKGEDHDKPARDNQEN